jgi:hypothetical protein
MERSAERVQAAAGQTDDQAMFEALGEFLAWATALDDLLHSQNTSYLTQRNVDDGGKYLQGLRFARNQLLHGNLVVHVADQALVRTPRIFVSGRAQYVRPATQIVWRFMPVLPPPGQRQPANLAAYTSNLADVEVWKVVRGARSWFQLWCP